MNKNKPIIKYVVAVCYVNEHAHYHEYKTKQEALKMYQYYKFDDVFLLYNDVMLGKQITYPNSTTIGWLLHYHRKNNREDVYEE